MRATAKFLFDTDFGGGSAAKPVISLADHAARLAQAEAVAYRSGYAAAEAKAAADARRDSAATLARIAAALDDLRRSFAALEARLEAEAVGIAVAVARKLAGELIAREPLAEITGLMSDCIRHFGSAPHVVVRVNDRQFHAAQDALTAAARERGFEGRLVVLGAPEIAAGDCRIEWADGGIVRDRVASDAAIDELVTRYLTARGTDAAVPLATPAQREGTQR